MAPTEKHVPVKSKVAATTHTPSSITDHTGHLYITIVFLVTMHKLGCGVLRILTRDLQEHEDSNTRLKILFLITCWHTHTQREETYVSNVINHQFPRNF